MLVSAQPAEIADDPIVARRNQMRSVIDLVQDRQDGRPEFKVRERLRASKVTRQDTERIRVLGKWRDF